jgi:ABC-2 type transport system permease protein
MNLAAGFRIVLALTRKKLAQELTYKASLITWFIFPFLFIAPYVYQARFFAGPGGEGVGAFTRLAGTDNYLAFIVVGATLWYWLTNLLWEIGFSIRDEQSMGTLEQLWLTPAPRWLLIAGNAAANTVINTFMSVAVLGIAHLWFGLRLAADPGLLALACGLSWLALYGMGFFYSGLVMLLKEAEGVVRLGNEVVLALAGVTYPLAVLPGWAGVLGKAIPLSWALKVLRGILLEGRGWAALSSDLLVLALFAVLTPAAGLACFGALERVTRRRGILGEY